MTFEQVLGRLKFDEGKIRRYSWTKGVCLARGMEPEQIVVIHPTGDRSDWIPEVGDLFADDWEVIQEGGCFVSSDFCMSEEAEEVMELIDSKVFAFHDAVDFVRQGTRHKKKMLRLMERGWDYSDAREFTLMYL
jgi:hypothetical protein